MSEEEVKAKAQLQAKRQTYRILKKMGLPIPPALEREVGDGT